MPTHAHTQSKFTETALFPRLLLVSYRNHVLVLYIIHKFIQLKLEACTLKIIMFMHGSVRRALEVVIKIGQFRLNDTWNCIAKRLSISDR